MVRNDKFMGDPKYIKVSLSIFYFGPLSRNSYIYKKIREES